MSGEDPAKQYAICEPNGQIRWIIIADEETAYKQVKAGQLFLETEEPIALGSSFYNTIVGEFQNQVPFPALSVDVQPITGGHRITIAQIPVGTLVVWPDGETTVENDGTLEAEVTVPGQYTFAFENPRHYIYEEFINVEA
jgi:hypothetical protein